MVHHPRSRAAFLLVMCLTVVLASFPQAPARAATRNIVERWRGTISINKRFNGKGSPADLLVLNGQMLEQYDLHYDFKADDTGFINGDIAITLNSVSIKPGPERICSATGVIECSINLTITQPTSSLFWEGKRFVDAQGQPRFKLEHDISNDDGPQVRTTMCGKVAPLYDTYQCVQGRELGWNIDTPTEFIITPYKQGRSALATPINAQYSDDTMAWDYTGQLIGVGQEPFVTLDTELLERSNFFTEIPVDDQLDANLDWNSADGGRVTWQIAQQPDVVGPTRDTKVTKHKDVGFPAPGAQTVQVQATNGIGLTSNPETTQINAIRWPVSAETPANVVAQKKADVVAYRYRFLYPNPPFKAQIEYVPEGVPFFGGGPLGIEDTQAGAEVEMLSTGEGYAKFEGKTAFTGMRGTLVGSVSGKVQARQSAQHGIEFPSGEYAIKIGGRLKNKEPLLELIPAFRGPALAIQNISPAVSDAINKLFISAELEPKVDLKFKVKDDAGKIAFVSGQARTGLGFKANLVLELVKDTAVAQVGVGGEVVQVFNVPAPYLGDTEVKLLAAAKVVLGTYSFENERAVLCTMSGVTLSCNLNKLMSVTALADTNTWQPIDRAYMQDANYGRWTGADQPVVKGTTNDRQLVAAVNPYANPSLALVPDASYGVRSTYLAWMHDRADKPIGSSREINVATRETTNDWKGPFAITNDSVDDWNPQMAATPNQYPLVVWQRMDAASLPDFNTNPNGYLSHMQIAGSRLGTTPGVVAPVMLSSGSLNYRPQVGTTATGALAVWVNNAANQIGGDAAHPDALMFARYTESGNTWSTAVPVVGNLAGLVDYHLATNGANAAIVYTLDADGDRSTSADRELLYTRWQNNAWTAPQQLTADGVADEQPQLALTSAGDPLLVWKHADALVQLRAWDGTPTSVNLPDAAERADYELKRAADDTLALVWQEGEASDTRVGYAIYDAARAVWSDTHTITPPTVATDAKTSMAVAPAAVLASGGVFGKPRLVATYLLADVNNVTRTVAGETYNNVQQTGTHSLRVVEETIGANLSISAADLSVTPAQAMPGQTVQVLAAVHNTGQFAVENVPVVLQSVPSDEPYGQVTDVATQMLPLTKPGETYTVTFDVQRPATARNWSVNIPVTDAPCPTQPCIPKQLETNYTDNTASLNSDLSITPLPTIYTSQGVIAQAQIQQTGGLYTTSATSATVRLDAPDGPIVGDVAVAFPISETATLTAAVLLSPMQVGAGKHTLYWGLDPGNLLQERNRDDNTLNTAVDVLPDLTSEAALLGWDRAPGSSAGISLRVENHGSAASAASVAEVRDGTTLLASMPVPAIAPGGFVELEGTLALSGSALTSGLQSLSVRLDPSNAVAETNENNNVIVGGVVRTTPTSGSSVFLPLIQRK